jgi:threonine synthase
MEYISTRDKNIKASSAQVIAAGIAPGGGLYTPCSIPRFLPGDLDKMRNMDYKSLAAMCFKCT